MEIIQLNQNHIIDDEQVIENKSPFIEANTQKVTLQHLKEDCIVPVFAKDGEVTISHYQFIHQTREVIQNSFPDYKLKEPTVRVSHIIKGRIPSAIGKAVNELLEHEKTIYYERCMFAMEIPEVVEVVNGNKLSLTVGGVRSLSQENLYSKKSLERFKVFIGFQNRVCTNLCVSTDGLLDDIRIGSILDLEEKINDLSQKWNLESQLGAMKKMSQCSLTEKQFAHLIGKARMYHHLKKSEQKGLMHLEFNDTQINNVVKEYYNCPNFSRRKDGTINLWQFYNLLTSANKSSYIDNFLERGRFAFEFTQELANSIQNNTPNWYLNN